MSGQYATPRSRLARSVVQYLEESRIYPYATLKGVDSEGAYDVLDIELELELEQRRKVPIHSHEPIQIIFMASDDSWAPRVLSRREDFPVGMVHTNLDRDVDGGLCLCIWEEGWTDLAISLTGQVLIERIRAWFASMSTGTIHDAEQFLEPLIRTSSNTLIIPSGELYGPWHIGVAFEHAGRITLSMTKEKPAEPGRANEKGFAIYAPRLPGQVHRGLGQTPYDLAALQRLCLEMGFDLVDGLANWLLEAPQREQARSRLPLLILTVPKRRVAEGPDEEQEVWCYTLAGTMAELGERLDVTITDDKTGLTTEKLFGVPAQADLLAIQLDPWRVVQRLNRSAARYFSGTSRTDDAPLLAIGAGAIGSNVSMIATRSGLGPWVVVDGDLTMPHNTVRQVQRNMAVGFPKAAIHQIELDSVFDEGGNTAISVDVFKPGDDAARLELALRNSAIAVDFSASPAVLGWLADQPVARAVSAFFGPDGSDLVILAENSSRQIRLDEIEAQYFWAVATEESLKGHLAAARMDRIRYANACQDLSRPLPPWQLHTLCGLAAGRLAQVLDEKDASFKIWRLNPDSGAVEAVCLPVHSVSRFTSVEMQVTVSDDVVRIMRDLRQQAGANETGGVLLGTYDNVRNTAHIVAALPAPPDSKQTPTYFIRGIKDLKPRIERLSEASAGRLQYIGEWHSHTGRVPARPSNDDEVVFTHLKNYIGPAGSPYVVAICGESDSWIRMEWQERGILEGVIAHGHE
ncbi:Mov34/MPN/PAD-1 family protein [Pseudomonas gingeri]|uniref:Mov34/MPN/PAD-1 family protein n=1 Tax=Pseudomonas gingeri TaxID=117681 RepID=UPI0015BF5DF3|nr:Mov34/MPN/PAD-1 family protein [Pseudomonas gingeri]NWD50215.1 Mov34/MPN/PAD-1 family protein [Pseudomonas gingeri]